MQKEFSNWTEYDQWLISDYGIISVNGKEKMVTNYDRYFINSVEKSDDGNILVDYEEANTPR
ncbi:hypothetical protein [Treponema sp.]|uniref:hypothetical protein n=1 Tax=Treponema sp. TaxID=166 RepID=UPI003F0935B2